MISWRESASQQVKDDLNGLLNGALLVAQQMLENHGDFFPYGVSLSLGGEGSLVAGYEGDEHPSSSDVLSLLIDGLRQQREQPSCGGSGFRCPDGRLRYHPG